MSEVRPSVELLTPPGAGGVAVLSVKGPRALARLGALTGAGVPPPGGVRLAILREPDAAPGDPPLDEALLVGRSEGVEVHTHGSPSIIAAVTEWLAGEAGGGGAPAGVGALSLEERAERAAATAPSAIGARVLLDQAGGALRRELTELADLEPAERRRRLAALASEGQRCARLWTPTVVAIVGPVNAGKSTLFNTLLGEHQATVTPRPGTTRDALAAPAELGGWPVFLVDTAGERDLAPELGRGAEVEAEGQLLARGVASRADLVLELTSDAAVAGRVEAPAADGAPPRLRLRSRAAEQDGAEPAGWSPLAISALEEPAHARARVGTLFKAALGLGDRSPWEAGRAVPFEPDLVAHMCDLATGETVERSALASLLAAL